jgi:hypothetical protein
MSHETPGTMGESSRQDVRAMRFDAHSAVGRRSTAARTGALSPFGWAVVGVLLGAVLLLGGTEIREQLADTTTAAQAGHQHAPAAADDGFAAEPVLAAPADAPAPAVLGHPAAWHGDTSGEP